MVGATTKDSSGLVGEQAINDLQLNGVCSTTESNPTGLSGTANFR
jgi:hypothetical protein